MRKIEINSSEGDRERHREIERDTQIEKEREFVREK